ncbi:MAG TPA: response regulator transcription factor [Vampirovibrionales bacterium]
MFKEAKAIRSVLWGQRFNNLPADQLVPVNLGARVHSLRVLSREHLIEQSLAVKPDLIIFEVDTPGEKSWSQLINIARTQSLQSGFVPLINNFDSEIIKDLTAAKVNSIVKLDRIHFELPYAIRAFQKDETFLTPQVAKQLCSMLQTQLASSLPSQCDRGLLTSLTNRELEVLACLTQGLNYKGIAKKLFVSDSTVKTHVNNIFTKLNVNDRTQAVLYGLRHGIDEIAADIFQRMEANYTVTSEPIQMPMNEQPLQYPNTQSIEPRMFS